ncbi:MAG: pirin family protein [Microthrixaceae bacterium]
MSARGVREILPAHRAVEGDGFEVRRPFPVPGRELVDPFLLLDHLGPVEHAPGAAIGTPEHPHRGFETVTYLLEGELEHRDSLGNHGFLGPGDTQWMTAGRGVLHQEGPSERLRTEGGRVHGVQLWVNLPAAEKMTEPAYQDLTADRVPRVEPGPGARARVIAGEAFGVTGPGRTRTPITYVHLSLEPGATASTPLPPDHTVIVYPMVGPVEVGGRTLAEGELGLLGPGDAVTMTGAGDATTEVLVLSGRPLHEPVARMGPFVMNTRAELVEAVDDLRAGRFATG